MKNSNKGFKMLVLAILVLCCAIPVSAVNKVMLIHGFESDQTSWESKLSGADLLLNTVIDDTAYFNYDIKTQSFNTILSNLTSQILTRNTLGDKWLIIGHSLGGILARTIEPTLRINSNFDLVGILTIGTPHQGAPAADVTTNDASGFLTDWHDDVAAGPAAGNHALVNTLLAVLQLYGIDNAALANDLPDLLMDAKLEGDDWVKLANAYDADDLLGPMSSTINNLNNVTTHSEYRSIIGAERSPTIMRWSSEMDVFFSSYNETEVMDAFDNLELLYSTNESAYRANYAYLDYLCWFEWFPGIDDVCDEADERKIQADAWEKGVTAWQNIDTKWSQAIGGGQPLSYHQVSVWHPPYYTCGYQCIDMSSVSDGSFDFEVLFSAQGGDVDCWYSCWTEEGYFESRTVAVLASSKNDGLIQPNAALWKDTDDWTPNSLEDMHSQRNFYYSDTESNGGWNHSEMMRYSRIYDEPDDGTMTPPLSRNINWINAQFIQGE